MIHFYKVLQYCLQKTKHRINRDFSRTISCKSKTIYSKWSYIRCSNRSCSKNCLDEENSEKNYDEYKGEAWSSFYKLSVDEVQENFIEAFSFLMKERGFKMILTWVI